MNKLQCPFPLQFRHLVTLLPYHHSDNIENFFFCHGVPISLFAGMLSQYVCMFRVNNAKNFHIKIPDESLYVNFAYTGKYVTNLRKMLFYDTLNHFSCGFLVVVYSSAPTATPRYISILIYHQRKVI